MDGFDLEQFYVDVCKLAKQVKRIKRDIESVRRRAQRVHKLALVSPEWSESARLKKESSDA